VQNKLIRKIIAAEAVFCKVVALAKRSISSSPLLLHKRTFRGKFLERIYLHFKLLGRSKRVEETIAKIQILCKNPIWEKSRGGEEFTIFRGLQWILQRTTLFF